VCANGSSCAGAWAPAQLEPHIGIADVGGHCVQQRGHKLRATLAARGQGGLDARLHVASAANDS